MTAVSAAITPLYLLVAFGFLLRRRNLFGPGFWDTIERLVFYYLFPALLVSRIGSADLTGLNVLPLAAVLIGGTLFVSCGALLIKPHLSMPDSTFVSTFQGITRPNTYLGLSIAAALYGNAGIALVAVCIVAVIPLVNFLAVVVHLRWADNGRPRPPLTWASALTDSLRNPVIAGCLIGAGVNISGLGLPPVVGPFLILIGKAALPLGLMAVGAGLDFSSFGGQRPILLWTAAVKLLFLPFITWILCVNFAVEGVSQAVCVLFAGLPVSATSYVMARQMGGDGQLMAAVVTTTTLLATVTLPLIASFYH